MRAEAWRANSAPSRDIVTVIESAVPCSFGGETGHRLRFAIDGGGHLKEIAARCPRDPDFLDGVERLGGFCCCQTLDKYIDYVLSNKAGYADNWGGPAEKLGVPLALRDLLKKAREGIASLRAKRLREVGENKPPTTVRLLPTGAEHFSRNRVIRIVSSVPLVLRTMRAASGMDMKLVFKMDFIPSKNQEDEPRDAWILKVGYFTIAYRDWGKRGWHFDEVKIRQSAIPLLREDVFVDPRENKWNARIPQMNTYCKPCKKTVNARNLSGHARTVSHADHVMNQLYKAMKVFPGPRRKR